MEQETERIEATRRFRAKAYQPQIADKLADMPYQIYDMYKSEINRSEHGMIGFFLGCMKDGAIAVRIIPDRSMDPDLEEFYPAIYFGMMSKDNPDKIRPYFFFNEFKPRPYDVVLNARGEVEFGKENLKTILKLPTQKVLQGRRDRGETEFGNTPIVDTIVQQIRQGILQQGTMWRIRKHAHAKALETAYGHERGE